MMFRGVVLVAAIASAWAVPQVERPAPSITVYAHEGVEGPGVHQLRLQDLQVRPVIVVADVSSYGQHQQLNRPLYGRQYVAYYLHYGLRSLGDHENFSQLYEYLVNSDGMSGVAFFPGSFQNPSFFKNYIKDLVLPENFNLLDFFRALQYPVPVLFVSPQIDFVSYDFKGITDIGTFLFANSSDYQQLQGGLNNRVSEPFSPYYPGPFPFPQPYYPNDEYPTLVVPLRRPEGYSQSFQQPEQQDFHVKPIGPMLQGNKPLIQGQVIRDQVIKQ